MNKIGTRRVIRRQAMVEVSMDFVRDLGDPGLALAKKMLTRAMNEQKPRNGWLPWRPMGEAVVAQGTDAWYTEDQYARTQFRMRQPWEERFIGRSTK